MPATAAPPVPESPAGPSAPDPAVPPLAEPTILDRVLRIVVEHLSEEGRQAMMDLKMSGPDARRMGGLMRRREGFGEPLTEADERVLFELESASTFGSLLKSRILTDRDDERRAAE